MRIKIDFITNSSTTSFCICGTIIDDIYHEKYKELKEKAIENDEYDEEDIYSIIEYLEKNSDLSITKEPYDNILYMGLSITRMKEDETLKQFRERAFLELQKFFPDIEYKDVDIIIDAWRDG